MTFLLIIQIKTPINNFQDYNATPNFDQSSVLQTIRDIEEVDMRLISLNDFSKIAFENDSCFSNATMFIFSLNN